MQLLRNDRVARSVLTGRGGKMVQAKTAPDGSLQELVARYPAAGIDQARTHFTRLTLRLQAGQWIAEMQTVPFGSQVRLSQREHSQFALCRHRRSRSSRQRGQPAGRDFLGRDRLPP